MNAAAVIKQSQQRIATKEDDDDDPKLINYSNHVFDYNELSSLVVDNHQYNRNNRDNDDGDDDSTGLTTTSSFASTAALFVCAPSTLVQELRQYIEQQYKDEQKERVRGGGG